jgi:50S ribosomal subunit-associated GTPase HflX
LVVANKMDESVAVDNLKKFKRKVPKTPVLQMSAGLDDGIDAFRKAIREAVELARQPDKTDVGTSDPTPDSSESAAH